jgi:hypothetical protein
LNYNEVQEAHRVKYDMMIEWENGETTSKPPAVIAMDDPVTCAFCAAENNESLIVKKEIEGRRDDRVGEWGDDLQTTCSPRNGNPQGL